MARNKPGGDVALIGGGLEASIRDQLKDMPIPDIRLNGLRRRQVKKLIKEHEALKQTVDIKLVFLTELSKWLRDDKKTVYDILTVEEVQEMYRQAEQTVKAK